MAALATILLTFYGLTAISRHDIAPPSSSRYLTVGIVFLLLMLVEAARGWKIRTWVPFVVLLLVWVSFGKADGNADALRDGRILFLQRSEHVRASLGAVELLGPRPRRRRRSRSRRSRRRSSRPGRGSTRSTACAATRATARRSSRARRPTRAASPTTRSCAPAGWRCARRRELAPADAARRLSGAIVPPEGVRVEAGATRPRTVRARRFGTEWKSSASSRWRRGGRSSCAR